MVLEPVSWHGKSVRSRVIRQLLLDGDVEEAAQLLGRPYHVAGNVQLGDRLGSQIGIPTANLAVAETKLRPGDGVYATRAWIVQDGVAGLAAQSYASVTNIGVRPTVNGATRRVETHLLDFPPAGATGDLYGQELVIEFVARLRGEKKFAGLEPLVAQIRADIATARPLWTLRPSPHRLSSSPRWANSAKRPRGIFHRLPIIALRIAAPAVDAPPNADSIMAPMRLLFLSAQIPGHLDWGGYLATAAELTRRGHRVLWASGPAVRGLVEGAGVPFHALAQTGWRWPPPPPLTRAESAAAPDAAALLRLKQTRALDQWLDVPRVAAAAEEVIALGRTFAPDLLVTEMFVAAAGLAAEALDRPLVVTGWPAPPPAQTRENSSAEPTASSMAQVARGRLDTLLAQFGLAGRNWTEQGPPALLSPALHLTYWSPHWFEGVAMGAQTRHAGRPTSRPAAAPAARPALARRGALGADYAGHQL